LLGSATWAAARGKDARPKKETAHVQSQFTVGINVSGRGERIVVKAEDALIAVLKVKAERPEASITYVRLNRRGDARHPPNRLATPESSAAFHPP
jgi:hypothetical protein